MLKKIILIAALVMALTCSASAQRNTSGNLNFTLTTNFLFYPGEKPSVNLSASDYYTKFEKNKKYNYDFAFTVYKIKDVDDEMYESVRDQLNVLANLNPRHIILEIDSYGGRISSCFAIIDLIEGYKLKNPDVKIITYSSL